MIDGEDIRRLKLFIDESDGLDNKVSFRKR